MAKYFISGIDTNIGKTVATGWLARKMRDEGVNVITQKLVQTGCVGISEDILEHRRIMGCGVLDVDRDGTTCRYVVDFPSSPHLACPMAGVELDFKKIAADTDFLEKKFGTVLIEGAGGLLVPLTENFLTADYILCNNLPLILVVSSRLGSLNHALLSLEYCRAMGIKLHAVIYNNYPAAPAQIEESTRNFLKKYLSKNFGSAEFFQMNKI